MGSVMWSVRPHFLKSVSAWTKNTAPRVTSSGSPETFCVDEYEGAYVLLYRREKGATFLATARQRRSPNTKASYECRKKFNATTKKKKHDTRQHKTRQT